MSDMGLTPQQAKTLAFISEYLAEHGVGPSFAEIMVALDIKSKSGVHRVVSALEERGHIHTMKHRARAISLGRAPVLRCPRCQCYIEPYAGRA